MRATFGLREPPLVIWPFSRAAGDVHRIPRPPPDRPGLSRTPPSAGTDHEAFCCPGTHRRAAVGEGALQFRSAPGS